MLESTKAKYRKSARGFGVKNLKGKPYSEQLLIDTLIEVAPNYTAKSFNNLKGALRFFFDEKGKNDLADKIKKLVNPCVAAGTTKKKLLKKKTLNRKELGIISLAIKEKLDHSMIAAYMLAYNFGVRPSEMQSIRQTGKLTFFITGSKKTAEGNRGLDRHIQVNSSQMATAIQRSIHEIQSKNINNIQERFNYLMKKLFPRKKATVTLYTLRHQFCSELKSATINPHIIAYLMGHQSTRTQESYGYARSGTGKVNVKPAVSISEIHEITRDKHSKRAEKMKLRFSKNKTAGQVQSNA